MTYPRSGAELLRWIDRDWDRFVAKRDAVGLSLIGLSGPFGWSVKDVVANIAAWERGLIALLEKRPRYAAMGIAGADETINDIDAINALIYLQCRNQSFAEVRRVADATHRELRARLDRMPWDDLQQPVAAFQPFALDAGTESALAYVAGDTYEHYVEHLPDLDAIVAAVAAANDGDRPGGLPRMDHPTSKAELMERIDRAWTSFRDVAFTVDDSAAATPGPDGWSAKDQIAHVSAWERSLMGLLQKGSRAAAMGVEESLYAAHDTDAINAQIYARVKVLPLAEVKRQADATHAELLAVLDGLSWEDLNKPYSDYVAGAPADGPDDDPVGAWVVGNTYEHYSEHQGYLEKTVAAVT